MGANDLMTRFLNVLICIYRILQSDIDPFTFVDD